MKVSTLQANIETLEAEIRRLKAQKADEIRKCMHVWTVPMSDHIYTEGYTIPGDPPGTCGVDWRGPVYVDAKTEKRWRRKCTVCGHVEYTSRVEQHIEEVPKFD